MKKNTILVSLLIVLAANIGLTQQNKNSPALKISKIMQDPDEWIGSLPDNIFWSDDSKTIYFEWNPEKKPIEDLYKIEINGDSQHPEKADLKEKRAIPPRSADFNNKKSKKVYARDGNLVIYNVENKTSEVILKSFHSLKSPKFTFNDKGIVFIMDGDLFKWNLDKKKLVQLVDFERKKATSKETKKKTPKEKWLYNQQMDLFKVLRRRERNKSYKDSIENINIKQEIKTVYTKNGSPANIILSPDEKYITYNLFKRGKSKRTRVPHFISSTGYLEIEKARSKVGGSQYQYGLQIYNIEKDSVYSVNTSNIPGIKDKPKYLKDYPGRKDENTIERKVNIFGPYWSDNGKKALISVRAADNKDRWLMLLDMKSGNTELLDRQRDEAWIAGPGIGSTGWREKIGWLPDNKHIWFQSEKSGYSHLYIMNVENKKEKQLTKGKFEIYNPRISKDKKYWYFNANKTHPGERQFYKMPLMGGKMEQLTFMKGRNNVALSPDENYMAIHYSSANQPWEIYFKRNTPEAKPVKLTNSLTSLFKAYDWRKPQIITFKARDEKKVYARLYKPENKNKKETPAVIFVHGAGYLQNAHNWWSKYFREYMFHNLLVDKGYTVLDIDYRGSAGYGRDWRTGIYRHMGGKDLTDHIDGAKYLVKKQNVDPERIGIYGGSYGGFITLMALFKNPETFAAGAALRSVTDWAHYNHTYTSNILNQPTEDSIAYQRSSPINFAEGLEDPLLICHGMIDDNVQFQDVVRLTQRFIELGKENWELAVYPMERHSFKEPESWTDEYRRILKLFEENLK